MFCGFRRGEFQQACYWKVDGAFISEYQRGNPKLTTVSIQSSLIFSHHIDPVNALLSLDNE